MLAHHDPDRWQAALPEPFNFLNQILQETLDDVLLEITLKEEVARIENMKPKPDDESGAVVLGATFTYALPAELDNADADSVLEPIAEGVYAVALASGALWLWSLSGQVPPLQIGAAGAGLKPCVLACTPLPASSGPPARKRLVMLSAKPEPPPDVNVNAGPEDAQLLAFDLTPPVLGTTTTWTVAPVGAFKLAALGRARATLSSDGRFCACVLRDCSVAVYHLPLPSPVPPPPAEGGAKLGAKAAAPAPAPAAPPPFLLLTVPAQAAGPPASVGCHFVLAPAPRSLGAALSWQACGLLSWGEGGSKLLQTVLPSASALAAKGAAAATSTSATLEWRLPGALTASAASADSVLIATGLDEGSVVLWDTNVRSDRYVLQRHGAAVTQLALHGAQLCISYAADFTLHGYDVSADPETGQGKLTFRRRLEHGMQATWLAIGAQLPLVLLGSPDAIRIFDMQGDLLALFNPHAAAAKAGLSGGAALLTARPGPCTLLLSSQHYSVSCLAMPATAPSLATGEPGAEPGAEAEAPQLACLSLSAALLATYPHLPGLVGGEVPVPLLATLLKSYTHAQRQDAQLMAAAPLLVQGGTLGGSTKGGGSRTKKGGGSRAGQRGKGAGTALSVVAEEDSLLQASRVSGGSSIGATPRSSGRQQGGAGGGITEQAIRAREGGATGGSSVAGSAALSKSLPVSGSRGGLSMIEDRRSVGGGTIASSVGTTMSDASHGNPPFVDPVSKVQRLQRSRLHGRFQREARVQRRWEELKALAVSMQQQEMQQAAAARQQQLKSR